MTQQTSVQTKAAALNGQAALLNSGFLRLYSGTQPAATTTALTGQTLLSEHTLSATAFASTSTAVATANAIGSDASANASGTATFYRAFASNGTTVHRQGSVGLSGSGAELIMDNTSIVAGGVVSISGWTITQS